MLWYIKKLRTRNLVHKNNNGTNTSIPTPEQTQALPLHMHTPHLPLTSHLSLPPLSLCCLMLLTILEHKDTQCTCKYCKCCYLLSFGQCTVAKTLGDQKMPAMGQSSGIRKPCTCAYFNHKSLKTLMAAPFIPYNAQEAECLAKGGK